MAVVFEWDASIGVTQFGLEVVYSLADVVGPNASSSIFATDEYLVANEETTQRFVDAIAESLKVIHTEPGAYEAASAKALPRFLPRPLNSEALGCFRCQVWCPATPSSQKLTGICHAH